MNNVMMVVAMFVFAWLMMFGATASNDCSTFAKHPELCNSDNVRK